ncbi:hypothetical protein BH11BAC1_BH11BAC1_02290 [soil metagenome]
MKFVYLLVDFFTILVPFIFSYHPRLNFYKNFKAFSVSNILIAVLFISGDILFTRLGVWGFNPEYVLGIYFFNLPVEEILFFICIPFSCVFTYHCLNLFFNINRNPITENIIILSVSTILMVAGIYFHDKLYTSTTFICLSLALLALKFFLKINWLTKLFVIYPVLILPFFIVNGILTGSGLDEPVVWYDNAENLGIRLFSIPVEDVFYGFLLILLNIFLYEYLKPKFRNADIEMYEQGVY